MSIYEDDWTPPPPLQQYSVVFDNKEQVWLLYDLVAAQCQPEKWERLRTVLRRALNER